MPIQFRSSPQLYTILFRSHQASPHTNLLMLYLRKLWIGTDVPPDVSPNAEVSSRDVDPGPSYPAPQPYDVKPLQPKNVKWRRGATPKASSHIPHRKASESQATPHMNPKLLQIQVGTYPNPMPSQAQVGTKTNADLLPPHMNARIGVEHQSVNPVETKTIAGLLPPTWTLT